jgi:hypothetical protein
MERIGEGPSCGKLWLNWLREEPIHPLAAKMKERIDTYTKEDWNNMTDEAYELMEAIVELTKYNLPKDGFFAKYTYDLLLEHYDKWFVPLDSVHLSHFAMLAKYGRQKNFFDKYWPGAGEYVSDIIKLNLDRQKQNDSISS